MFITSRNTAISLNRAIALSFIEKLLFPSQIFFLFRFSHEKFPSHNILNSLYTRRGIIAIITEDLAAASLIYDCCENLLLLKKCTLLLHFSSAAVLNVNRRIIIFIKNVHYFGTYLLAHILHTRSCYQLYFYKCFFFLPYNCGLFLVDYIDTNVKCQECLCISKLRSFSILKFIYICCLISTCSNTRALLFTHIFNR